MKWDETTASACRYGDVAGTVFGDADIIWENSEADWQGYANILGVFDDSKVVYYEWTYGSCSICDEWEARNLTETEIAQEMTTDAEWFNSIEEALKYFSCPDTARVPVSGSPTNASISGMMRICGNERFSDYDKAGEALYEYSLSKEKDNARDNDLRLRCTKCIYYGRVYETFSDDDDNSKTVSSLTCKKGQRLFGEKCLYREIVRREEL